MIMMIDLTLVHVRGGRRGGRLRETMEEFEWSRRREMEQPIQQHVAPCVKGVEWGLGTRGLRRVAGFSTSIPVSSA